jgi:16S rRNA (guanine527-N7)-methyltransferase
MQQLKTGAARLGIELTPLQLEQFYIYYRELLEWSRRMNLTSITKLKEVQVKHFLDSITVISAIKQPVINNNIRFIDIGSGPGFPGLPLKITFPDIKLALLEASGKKATFLQHLTRRLALKDVEVLVGRAEEIAHRARYRQQFDIVLSRAVAALPALAELILPFCAIGGRVIIQKKGDIKAELSQAARVIELLGGSQPEIKKIEMAELTDDRCLIIIDKLSPIPAKYPRRPGMPAKRPII